MAYKLYSKKTLIERIFKRVKMKSKYLQEEKKIGSVYQQLTCNTGMSKESPVGRREATPE